jgi:hypothetical protein
MQPHNLEKVKKILSRYENYFKLKWT